MNRDGAGQSQAPVAPLPLSRHGSGAGWSATGPTVRSRTDSGHGRSPANRQAATIPTRSRRPRSSPPARRRLERHRNHAQWWSSGGARVAVIMGRTGEGRASGEVRPRCGKRWERLHVLLAAASATGRLTRFLLSLCIRVSGERSQALPHGPAGLPMPQITARMGSSPTCEVSESPKQMNLWPYSRSRADVPRHGAPDACIRLRTAARCVHRTPTLIYPDAEAALRDDRPLHGAASATTSQKHDQSDNSAEAQCQPSPSRPAREPKVIN